MYGYGYGFNTQPQPQPAAPAAIFRPQPTVAPPPAYGYGYPSGVVVNTMPAPLAYNSYPACVPPQSYYAPQQGGYNAPPVTVTTSTIYRSNYEMYAPPQGYEYYSGGSKVALKIHGKHLVAEHGALRLEHHLHGDHGLFHIKHLHDDVVEIKTAHGQYVAIDGHQVYLTHEHHQHNTKFHLEHHGGRVAFRVHHHNKYLGAHWTEHKIHAHHERSHNELFEEMHY